MPNDLGKKIGSSVEDNLKSRLNIPAGQPLPQNLKDVINKTSEEAGNVLTERYVKKEAILQGKRLLRDQQVEATIGSRLSNALKGVQMVSQSADLDKMISENAKILFKKKSALETAGFTKDEAFQLILAEVSAKKSR